MDISGTAERPVVVIPAAGRGWLSSKVSVDELTIHERGLGPIWSISRTVERCRNHGKVRIGYGQAPVGFRQVAPAPSLSEGKVYTAVINGCGIIGGSDFKIADGRLFYDAGRGDDVSWKPVRLR